MLGEFGIADIMYAPAAVRFVTYGVAPKLEEADAYARHILAHPLVLEWLALGADDAEIAACELGGTGTA